MPDSRTELITFHGWGFSPKMWPEWEQKLPSDFSMKHADRGYFGEEVNPVFTGPAEQKVILTHSYGLHWCPGELIHQADHLVIVSGFLSFHPGQPAERRRSQLVLRQMMSRFVEKPEEVLSLFHKNAFYPYQPFETLPGRLDHDKLLEDLASLGISVLPAEMFRRIPAITIIHGGKDAIVSNAKSRRLYKQLRANSKYFEIKAAGHAVIHTHPTQCLKFLRPVLDSIAY